MWQVVYPRGILGGACMEFEGALVPSFRVRWEVERRADTCYYPGHPSYCWEMPPGIAQGEGREEGTWVLGLITNVLT